MIMFFIIVDKFLFSMPFVFI